jgi:hypothetical protein
MIYRIATTWTVAATMLLCPFICLVRASATLDSAAGGHQKQVTHSCCACSGCEGHKKAPCQRDSDRQGGTCLCHGAVLQSPTMPPSFDLGTVVFLSSDDLLSSAKSAILADSLFAVEHPACHFPFADSGQELRALIESFLL